MKQVDLFYLSPNPYGGWVTYTCHLIEALEAVGVKCNLFKIRPRTEKFTRKFGYDKLYRNISMEVALSRKYEKLIVAGAKQFKEQTLKLYKEGDANIVVHDPTELKNLPNPLDSSRCVVIRKIGIEVLKKATGKEPTFIRHPYSFMEHTGESRFNMERTNTTGNKAISTSRIDFDKRTDILLDANRLLPEGNKINIRGFENRIYTRFKIVPKYPEWEQSKAHYPREKNYAVDLMKGYTFNVDMTHIVGDGGGTQYTWLEAWNAGCIPIIHESWLLDKPDDMIPGYNCLTVNSPENLAEVLKTVQPYDIIEIMRLNGFKSLEQHSEYIIGQKYFEFLFERV
tara:strand:+ start:5907 stop:6926 length:1020 start_codon:yes stop_codon:yes gene_type:complete